MVAGGEGGGAAFAGGPAGAGRRGGGNVAMLWTTDNSGKLRIIPVRTGITDGTVTAIEGEGITEGMQVIAGVNQATGATATTNPFQGSGGGSGFRPGGF